MSIQSRERNRISAKALVLLWTLTCCRGTGCMVGLLGQIKDLLTGVRRGDGVLTLSGLNRVVLFPVVIGVKELLKPLDEIKIVLKSAFD